MTPVTPSFDDDERALARALHGRVDAMNESPLGLQDVSAKAGKIRRRRQVTAAVGVAAAVVILVPAAIAAGGFFGKDPEPPVVSQSSTPSATPSAVESPSASPSVSTPATPVSQVFDVTSLEPGAAPAVAYAVLDYRGYEARGGTIHGTDGSATPLPDLSLRSFAPLGDGYIVDMWDPDSLAEWVFQLDHNGATIGDGWQADGGIAVSPGGTIVAWTGTDGTVYTADAAHDEILTMRAISAPGPYRTVGVVGEDCKEGRSTDAGCTVFVNTSGTTPRAWFTTSHGIVDRLPTITQATAVLERRVAGVSSIDETEPGSCSWMMEDFSTKLWQSCDNTLGAISPDGTMLVGLPDYLDGFGPTTLDILDMADGTPIRSWTADQASATYFQEVWEDESHLLMVTFQDDEWAIVRLGADGSMDYAVPPVQKSMDHGPFVLARH